MINYRGFSNSYFQLSAMVIIIFMHLFNGGQDAIGKTTESKQDKLKQHITNPHYSRDITIKRTKHGVAHINASNYYGVGYGVGYVYTQDNRCLWAHRIAEVNGRLSEQLGADAAVRSDVHDITYTSLQSDHYFRGWFDIDKIRAGFAAGASEVRDMARGYANGVNRFLAEHPGGEPCSVRFMGKVTVDDIYRMWVATATVASGELVTSLLPHTAPARSLASLPVSIFSKNQSGRFSAKNAALPIPLGVQSGTFGSNAWAIGREGTKSGKSIHFYDPHFPWKGIQRLYMVHVTIPQKLDVMGVTLGGFPIPIAGFTRNVAWGLTFSPAARWSLAELALEGNPMTYKVNGATKQITSETISIPVLGESTPSQL